VTTNATDEVTPAVTPTDSPTDEDAFRSRVRSFLDSVLPRKGAPPRPGPDGVTAAKEFQARLAGAGLAGIAWPREYGGAGLPPRFQQIFDREAAAFQVPPRSLDIGLGMCGPTILAHGSEEQKHRFIPPLLRGDHVWCELFSEPGSGSDLASVQTRAVRDGDTWVLTGQKVWTSGAQYSDYAACLARTNVETPKHDGISMFLVDMHAPGITVRPLRQMTGESHFNEVFLDEVPVPAANVLGELNGGWRVARTMLAHERQTLGAMGSSGGGGRGGFGALLAQARERGITDRAEVRQQLADLRIRQMILRYLAGYLAANADPRRAGAQASLLKLAMAGVVQRTAAVAVDVAGLSALAWDPAEAKGSRWSMQLLNAPSASLGGGTNEVIRNLIGERVLGLPRDVEVDLDVPFRDLKVGTQK
jgi:alkylation response protein AidB-like acyl-CoA dehydrogenase